MRTARVHVDGNIDPGGNNWPKEQYTDLRRLRARVEAARPFDALEVLIDSPGGEVNCGYAMHDYLKALPEPVTTIAMGECASIATVIFAAGDLRLVSPNSRPMIHLPASQASGNMHDLQAHTDRLVAESARLLGFYTKATGHDAALLADMMARETYLTPEECVAIGLATGIYAPVMAKAVVAFAATTNNQPNTLAMSKLNTALKDGLKSIMAMLDGTATVALDLKTIDGQDLQTTSVGDTPAIGDAVTMGGEPLADGVYTLDSGLVIHVLAGVITDVMPVADMQSADTMPTAQDDATLVTATDAVDPRDAKIAELEAKLAQQEATAQTTNAAVTARLNTLSLALGQRVSQDVPVTAQSGRQPTQKVGEATGAGINVLELNKAKFGGKKTA